MMVIRCAKCKSKLFKYHKIGKGKILRLWKERIKDDYSIKDGATVKCPCGNIVGIDTGPFIKMKQGSFTFSGTYANK